MDSMFKKASRLRNPSVKLLTERTIFFDGKPLKTTFGDKVAFLISVSVVSIIVVVILAVVVFFSTLVMLGLLTLALTVVALFLIAFAFQKITGRWPVWYQMMIMKDKTEI